MNVGLGQSLFELTGRIALVTGGGHGIGRTCAMALARAGADVAIAGRDQAVGEETAAAIRKLGGKCFFVRSDVSQEDQVQSMVDTVARTFGRLDIAVNNAGIFVHGNDEAQTKDDWDRVVGVNLTGTWLCARAEMRQMIRQAPIEGKIINMASIAASIACSNGAYDAAKAGVVHLTRTLGARWGRYNINVNSLSPGYVNVPSGSRRSEQELQSLRERTPLGYAQRPEDLSGPLLFLASRASDYVTGQNLVVDGGHTLSTWITPLVREVPPRRL